MEGFFQGQAPGGGNGVGRCGAHDAMLFEVATLKNEVGHTRAAVAEFRADWRDHKDEVTKALSAVGQHVEKLNPSAVRSDTAKNGMVVSAVVSVVVAALANLDKIAKFWDSLQ